MPGMGGRELSVRLRERLPDLAVLYMSGFPELERGGVGPEADATLIAKPFTPGDLVRAVRGALGAPEPDRA